MLSNHERRRRAIEKLSRLGFHGHISFEKVVELQERAVATGLIFPGVPGRIVPVEGPDGIDQQNRLNDELAANRSEERAFWGGLLTGVPFLVLLTPAMANVLDEGDCFLDWMIPE